MADDVADDVADDAVAGARAPDDATTRRRDATRRSA
jgi:hypothetical protein